MSADTPTPEAKPGPASSGSYNRLTPLYVLIGLFAVCDVAIATVVDLDSDAAAGILFGMTFSQVILLAVWSALGPFGVFARTAFGAVVATLIGFVLVACIHNSTHNSDGEWLWFLIVVSQWFALHSSLWVVRLCFGWRLAQTAAGITTSSRSEVQFGIRQLLTWTALVAATLGIGRWLLPEDIVGALPWIRIPSSSSACLRIHLLVGLAGDLGVVDPSLVTTLADRCGIVLRGANARRNLDVPGCHETSGRGGDILDHEFDTGHRSLCWIDGCQGERFSARARVCPGATAARVGCHRPPRWGVSQGEPTAVAGEACAAVLSALTEGRSRTCISASIAALPTTWTTAESRRFIRRIVRLVAKFQKA